MHFIGREDILSDIEAYIFGVHSEIDSNHPLVIHGPSGSGKSALMSEAIRRLESRMPPNSGTSLTSNMEERNVSGKTVIIARFIGATPGSTEIETLLGGICHEITTVLQIRLHDKDFSFHSPNMQLSLEAQERQMYYYEKSSQCQQLFKQFRSILARIPDDSILILWLDGLDQLNPSNNSHALSWLPCDLKKNVRVLVSILSGEDAGSCISSAECKIPSSNFRSLPPLSTETASDLLSRWLRASHRGLQACQQEHILANFEGCQMPLYLKLAFEDARHWKSYDGLPSLPDGRCGLSKEMNGIICDMLSRLKRPENHGAMLVSRALAYLSASRNGLSEDEMIDVLSRDEDVLSDLRCRSPRSPEVNRLPVAVWCRLYSDLGPYLLEHRAGQASLIGFCHHRIGQVATHYIDELGKIGIHTKLAAYFEEHVSSFGIAPVPNGRKWFELPWQLCEAENWTRLYELLVQLTLYPNKVLSDVSSPIITGGDFWRYWARIENNTPLRLVEALRPTIDTPEDHHSDSVLWNVLYILVERRQLEQAGRVLTHLVNRLRCAGQLRELIGALGILAEVRYYEHQMDEALNLLDEEEAICRRIVDSRLLASCLLQRAVVLESLGSVHEALQIYEEQENVFRSLDDSAGVSACLSNRAVIAIKIERPDLAMTLLQKCERIELKAGDEIAYARTLYNQGIALRRLSMLSVAERGFLKSERIFQDVGDMEGVSGCLGNRAAILEDIGRPYDAVALLEEQARICRQTDYDEGLLRAQGNLARLLGLILGRSEEAEPIALDTLNLAIKYRLPYYQQWMTRVLAEIMKLRR